MNNANRKNNSSLLITVVDLSNTKLKQTTFCNQPNPLYHFGPRDNKIMFQLQKTEHFNAPIDASASEQPARLTIVSVTNTNQQREVMPNTIIGYIVKDQKNESKNMIYEIDYKENYGTRSAQTVMLYNGNKSVILNSIPILIVYIDDHKQIKMVGSEYLNLLLPSNNLNLKLGAHFTNQTAYMNQYYSILEKFGNFAGKSNLLIHLNPEGKGMEPNVTTPFTRMKATLITIKNAQGSAYCIRNVHPQNTVEEMRKYVNSSVFKALYTMKSGATGLSKLLNEMKSGDITQEYDRMIFFFMKQMDLLINFKNWIRTLANAIGVDAYISFVDGAGLNVQINVMENHSNKNMNLGVHSDYRITNSALYPDDKGEKKATARTILTYVDLYEKGRPVIGFTTKITGISQENAQEKLMEYSLQEKCANYVRLYDLQDRLDKITDEVEEKIKTIMKNNIRTSFLDPPFIPDLYQLKNKREWFTMIDSILIPDIDDPYYYFKLQRDALKKRNVELQEIFKKKGFDYRIVLNEVHEVLKTTLQVYHDISNWNTESMKYDLMNIERTYKTQFDAFNNKINQLFENNRENSIITHLYNMFFIRFYYENVDVPYIYALLMSDVDRFITLFMNHPKAPADVSREEIRAYLAENFQDTTEYQQVLYGNSCPFVDGGMVYFNGADTHTLDAGIGKRISIVYKVSFVDREPNNPKSIEEREKEYFDQFKDDAPLANPTVTRNNTGITYSTRPRARNFGGKRTVRKTRRNKRRHISRKKFRRPT